MLATIFYFLCHQKENKPLILEVDPFNLQQIEFRKFK
jgi:hypothetical protein